MKLCRLLSQKSLLPVIALKNQNRLTGRLILTTTNMARVSLNLLLSRKVIARFLKCFKKFSLVNTKNLPDFYKVCFIFIYLNAVKAPWNKWEGPALREGSRSFMPRKVLTACEQVSFCLQGQFKAASLPSGEDGGLGAKPPIF